MAIYFDSKVLEPKADGTALQQKYYRERNEIKDLFKRFRKNGDKEGHLILTRDYHKVWNTKKTSYKPAPPIAIPMNISMGDPELGAIQIRYSDSPPIKTDKKLVWGAVKKGIINENLFIPEKDIDFAWYIIKATSFIEDGIFRIVDKKAEYEGKFSEMKKQMDASRIIFDEDVTLERLETLADLVLPSTMKVTADEQEEYAAKFWDIIKAGEQAGKTYNYDALIEADKKVSKAQAADYIDKSGGEVISVSLDDGRTLSVPFVKCHFRIKDETLKEKADELNIPVKGITKDELYSVIKYEEAKAK
jgi:hypothetical protein